MTGSAHRDVKSLVATVRASIPTALGVINGDAIAALDALLARLEQVERERDDYRLWNERVRVCEKHTQDVAAPVGDCLICNLEQVEQERDEALRQRDHDYARFKGIKGSLIESDSRVITAEARVQKLEAALRRAGHELNQWIYADGSAAYRVERAEEIIASALAPDTAEER